MTATVYISNTNVVEIDGLQNEITQSYINDAAADVNITDILGNPFAGPITMPYVAASNGVYRCVISDSLPFDPAKHYIAFIEAIAPEGVGRWQLKFKPLLRKVF